MTEVGSAAQVRRRTPPCRGKSGHTLWDRGQAYSLWGPTFRSMQLEVYIWVVLMLIVVGNMQGIYRESFGTRGDCIFLLLAALWIGKHILLRWICCWDPSTVASPTLIGLLSHITTNHLMGGQIYDRPPPRQIAKFLGLKEEAVPLLQTAQSSLDYATKLWNRRGGRVLSKMQHCLESFRGTNRDQTQSLSSPKPMLGVVSKPRSRFGRLLADYQQQWKVVKQNLPSVQFLVYCAALFAVKALVRRRLLDFYKKETTSTYLYSASLGVTMKQETSMMKRKGEYQPRHFAEAWWEDTWSTPVLVFMALTMWVFARIVPPIPDLVSGSHPLKDIRNDKTGSNGAASSSSSSGSSSNSRGNSSSNGFWSKLAAMGFVNPTEHGWSEAQAPISTVPRIYVHTAVFILRMIDIFWVVLWLPRSDAVCQLTGHCVSAWDWSERTYYMYPVGITGPQRSDRPSLFFPNQIKENSSLYITAMDVLFMVPMLLLMQSLLTNRTYWASWAFCASEWTFVGRWNGSSNIPTWDARRKYKKNDIVQHHKRVFSAAVNDPEGRPYFGFQRYMQNLLVSEGGDPGTSGILFKLSGIQLFSFFIHFLFWYNFHLHSIECHGLLMALLANGLSTYVLCVAGRVYPSGLATINAEVTGVNKI